MLGLLAQIHNVPLDVLWCGMVVVENGRYLIADNVPRLANPNVDREYGMHDGEDEDV